VTIWWGTARGAGKCVGRGNLRPLATRYGLDGPGFEPRWGRGFQYGPQGPTSLLLVKYGSLPQRYSDQVLGVVHPIPSSTEFDHC
jgi:hypothetical protein